MELIEWERKRRAKIRREGTVEECFALIRSESIQSVIASGLLSIPFFAGTLYAAVRNETKWAAGCLALIAALGAFLGRELSALRNERRRVAARFGLAVCPSCGEIAGDAKFCRTCGKPNFR